MLITQTAQISQPNQQDATPTQVGVQLLTVLSAEMSNTRLCLDTVGMDVDRLLFVTSVRLYGKVGSGFVRCAPLRFAVLVLVIIVEARTIDLIEGRLPHTRVRHFCDHIQFGN